MRRWFRDAATWWYANTSPPAASALGSIAEREQARKARLLSLIIFFAIILCFPLLLETLYFREFLGMSICVMFMSLAYVAGLINRREHLNLATTIFISNYIVMAVWENWDVGNNFTILILWKLTLLLLPPLMAALLLPLWAPVVLMVIDDLLMAVLLFWLPFSPKLIALLDTSAVVDLLFTLCVVNAALTTLTVLAARSVALALVQADRAAEIEAAHIELERIHSDLSIAYAQLEQLATTDPITGLLNHRSLNMRLAIEADRSERTLEPLGIIFADLDHFKNVNDTWGHQAGDLVLAYLARCLRDNVRSSDVVARYGGEEFVVLLPNQDYDQSVQSAERLREQICAAPLSLPNGVSIPLTLSLGVAVFPQDGGDVVDVLVAADSAMYHAKHTGRNRVCLASELADAA